MERETKFNILRGIIVASCLENEQKKELIDFVTDYKDAEENGLLIRLDSKDELIKILATKLLESEFGHCYMCKNPMKNITLDGKNNGCDGQCNTSEEFNVDDFLKKIVLEIEALKQMGE